jgi:signal transduction histidine kinase
VDDLLPKDRRILERRWMEHQPYGIDPQGRKIHDVSGVSIRANVEYLEEYFTKQDGPESGPRSVEELVRRLNERIRDPAYHVTPDFLRNAWHGYSYEFSAYLGELCTDITGDPQFRYKMANAKFVSPLIQILIRPFSTDQLYRMFPHFGQKFAKGSLLYEVGRVTDRSAVLRMKFTEAVLRQFGPYRKACAALACQAARGSLASVPERLGRGPSATVRELSCIAEGDEYCEWEFTWQPQTTQSWRWYSAAALGGAGLWLFLRLRYPYLPAGVPLALSLAPLAGVVATTGGRALRSHFRERERLVQDQFLAMEARHEELREAYVEQEQATVELRRSVQELTVARDQIEALNIGLEAKVRERTIELELVNRQLADANARLRELDQLKSAFVSVVSHELRTPLTSIKGYVDNLLDGVGGSLSEVQEQHLQRVKNNADRLARMSNELLDLTRIESGRLELHRTEVAPDRLIADVVEGLQPMAREKTIVLEAEVAAPLPVLHADRDKLQQVLTNLIHNALKFTPAGGRVRVTAHCRMKREVVVVVEDTGCGIPPTELDRVFEKFYRSRAARVGIDGVGLGLAITKSLVELHGGTIRVESVPGQGSRFSFVLPVFPPDTFRPSA